MIRILGEIAFGPSRSARIRSLNDLPDLDRRALVNLARAMKKLESGAISLPNPLGAPDTRHYISPTLASYSRDLEAQMKARISNDPRRHVIRIPFGNPTYLAVVPNWAEQEGLIAEPAVKVDAREPVIPVSDFIYFKGLL
jgi:hypothetical protein